MLHVRRYGTIVEVELTGTLSPGAVRRLTDLLAGETAPASGTTGVVLNLKAVEPGSPEGLWQLLALVRDLEGAGIDVALHNIPARVNTLLQFVGFHGEGTV